ncbi:TIGR02679 family protein [Streptomyces sp. 5.8]|uniref:TIGR02679 family protein n=1 Tax=Streptomyces sp. 5.8 TaxID=3406571 RepID=UPI003BB50957
MEELRGAGWRRLLAAARRRLERTGGQLDGAISLNEPSEAERKIIIGVTGSYRPETAGRLTVRLTDLDLALSRAYGEGLLKTLAALDGPLRDRPAERAGEAGRRAQALSDLTSDSLGGEGWFTDWRDSLTADGTLTRLVRRGDDRLAGQAVTALEHLLAAPGPVPLPVLAERATGDTKALVPGSPLAMLVLRALALRTGVPAVPRDRTGQRILWESAGGIADDLASQVLVLNVRCTGDDVVSGWLNDAADFAIPFRLTLQQLTTDPVIPAARELYVCENPAVLRVAAAELGEHCPPLVCTEGIPSAACHRLLAQATGRLHWRADFDWTGLRITAKAIAAHRATPWRMSATDYRRSLDEGETTRLTGSPAPSPWDPALAALMTAQDRTVMEERLLPALLDDLQRAGRH